MSIFKTLSITMLAATSVAVAMENKIVFVKTVQDGEPGAAVTEINPVVLPLKADESRYDNVICLRKTDTMSIDVAKGCLDGELGTWRLYPSSNAFIKNPIGSFSPNASGFVRAETILEQDGFQTYKHKKVKTAVQCWDLVGEFNELSKEPTVKCAYEHDECYETKTYGNVCAPILAGFSPDGAYFATKHSCGLVYVFATPSFLRTQNDKS